MDFFYNNSNRKELRQYLRYEATNSERMLWQRLRGRNLGVKFRRQHGIFRYIVDFYVPSCRLAIEVDGGIHAQAFSKAYDEQRDAFLKAHDIRILRFTNEEVVSSMEQVIQTILKNLNPS